MDIVIQYGILVISAIFTQIIVSWAGSMLHSIGAEEIHYAVFTFSDERDEPMSTNILMNICIPNVLAIFMFLLARKFGYRIIEEKLILYVMLFYVFRYILVCVVLRRKELYNYVYEVVLAICGLIVAFAIKHFFLITEQTILITAYELREELWFVIIVIIYKFVKLIVDKYVRQNTVLRKSQIEKYVIRQFEVFYKKYSDIILVTKENRFQCIFIYSVMIIENYNRGPFLRKVENALCFIDNKPRTLGITQMKSEKPLSDKKSIIMLYNELSDSCEPGLIDGYPWNQAWKHNNDNAYADAVTYIFDILLNYLDEIPKYREAFFIRLSKEDYVIDFEEAIGKLNKLHQEEIIRDDEFESEMRKLTERIFRTCDAYSDNEVKSKI